MKLKLLLITLGLLPFLTQAQLGDDKRKFTKADTLRGSLNENRDWWDVLRYNIEVTPDYEQKTITGKVEVKFKEVKTGKSRIQIDLQQPLIIDSIKVMSWGDNSHIERDGHGIINFEYSKTSFERDGNSNTVHFNYPVLRDKNCSFIIYYHGTPKEAKNAPWDGGWIWSKDSLGRPWMSVAVQGLGASAWYPCKDHQSDEPDNGASLTIIYPDTLTAVANGRLTNSHKTWVRPIKPGYRADTWEVKNPINTYNIVPSLGKYVNWKDTFIYRCDTVNANLHDPNIYDTVIHCRALTLNYYVLDYNLDKAKKQFEQVKPMLRCFEHWFGPYPFYEDGYKLVETPFLGMEHQSNIAYGNLYRNGYRGKDLSGTGWGNKWDFIIIHESAHEWFANNITTKDIADMWVHESFANYSETLYTEWLFGKKAGDEYNRGTRKGIENDKPIIGVYGVNEEGSGDMYYKGGNMIHIIRKVINDDEKFRQLLRGMNKTFWHQTVTTQQVEQYISETAGINFQKTFDQYLRTIQIPRLEFRFNKAKTKVSYRWTNCIKGFDLPLVVNNKRYPITTKWKTASITKRDLSAWNAFEIVKQYYITAKQVKP
jgi:aminopeptidase N